MREQSEAELSAEIARFSAYVHKYAYENKVSPSVYGGMLACMVANVVYGVLKRAGKETDIEAYKLAIDAIMLDAMEDARQIVSGEASDGDIYKILETN